MKTLPLVLAAGAFLCSADVSAQVGASSNATLLARFDPSGSSYNDVWGYVSPSGGEYAVLGSTTGTFILDCTDPRNPRQVAFIPGPRSTWRDMRTYREYVYVVTEGGSGVQIIDMTNPDKPVLANTWGQSVFSGAHNVALDTGTGILYPCGTNRGTLIIDLENDPVNPTEIGIYSTAYVHDLHVQDGIAHLAEINNSRYRLLDVSGLPGPTTILGSASVPSCHNVWPSRDNKVAVTSSERSGGGLTVFDISDKRLPRQVAFWRTGRSTTSAHNVYVRDRVAHASYYSEGYRTLDISDPANPVPIAFYDTSSSTSGYSGAWGCYPFQPSGVVYISDISNGLHIFDTKATTHLYGPGTAGTAGRIPAIHTFGMAWKHNANFKIEVEDAAPGAPVTLLIGAASGATAVGGLTLNVDIAQPFLMLTATTDAAGKAQIPIPLASNLPLGKLFLQFLVTDAAGPLGLAASRGLEIELFSLGDS